MTGIEIPVYQALRANRPADEDTVSSSESISLKKSILERDFRPQDALKRLNRLALQC